MMQSKMPAIPEKRLAAAAASALPNVIEDLDAQFRAGAVCGCGGSCWASADYSSANGHELVEDLDASAEVGAACNCTWPSPANGLVGDDVVEDLDCRGAELRSMCAGGPFCGAPVHPTAGGDLAEDLGDRARSGAICGRACWASVASLKRQEALGEMVEDLDVRVATGKVCSGVCNCFAPAQSAMGDGLLEDLGARYTGSTAYCIGGCWTAPELTRFATGDEPIADLDVHAAGGTYVFSRAPAQSAMDGDLVEELDAPYARASAICVWACAESRPAPAPSQHTISASSLVEDLDARHAGSAFCCVRCAGCVASEELGRPVNRDERIEDLDARARTGAFCSCSGSCSCFASADYLSAMGHELVEDLDAHVPTGAYCCSGPCWAPTGSVKSQETLGEVVEDLDARARTGAICDCWAPTGSVNSDETLVGEVEALDTRSARPGGC